MNSVASRIVDPIELAKQRPELGSGRFECVEVFDLFIPFTYDHRHFVEKFREQYAWARSYRWNERINATCIANLDTDRLLPGRRYKVYMFKLRTGVEVPPNVIRQFFIDAGAVFAGVHGILAIYDSWHEYRNPTGWYNIPHDVSIISPIRKVIRHGVGDTHHHPVLRKGQDDVASPELLLACPYTPHSSNSRFPLFVLQDE